uniref:Uncharacterized protein n=1 Tax=Oryza sativa subsp. japonica TaxID=39947 RepID=Q6Z8K3_ORYSJ|nr:hypothetical protein [Oryza sativa Japonica Group]
MAAQTTVTTVAASCSHSTPPASRSLPDRVRLRAVGRSWRAVAATRSLAVDNLAPRLLPAIFLCVISGGGRWSQGQSCHFEKFPAFFDSDIIKYSLVSYSQLHNFCSVHLPCLVFAVSPSQLHVF